MVDELLDDVLWGHVRAIAKLADAYAVQFGMPAAVKSAYVSGLWLGLSTGIADVVAARVVREHLANVIQGSVGDPAEGELAVDELVKVAHASTET